MLVRWTPAAALDLEQIVRHIDRDRAQAAIGVARDIYKTATSLDRFPRRGRVGVRPGTREIIVPNLPYVVVYRVSDVCVEILRIHHGAQDRSAKE